MANFRLKIDSYTNNWLFPIFDQKRRNDEDL